MKNLWQRLAISLASVTVIAVNFYQGAGLASDPFRNGSGRNIGFNTESAFKSVFEKGNYPEGKKYLDLAEKTESNEPMVYALRGSLAYLDEDWTTLKTYADQTISTAQKLTNKDSLRGNLYISVGYFLKGASDFQKEGAIGAVKNLQKALEYLDIAEKIDSKDPELNLIKGYMELMIATKMPFANVNDAVSNLEKYGRPKYLAMRGIALGYRDLKKYDKAAIYADNLVQQFPNNPESQYLKGQILLNQKKYVEAKKMYKKALAKSTFMPKKTVAQIVFEYCVSNEKIDKKDYNCSIYFREVVANPGSWGPSKLPSIIK